MVPSDPISARSPPACTALSFAIKSAGRFACRLPYRRFNANRINASRHAACCLFLGTGSLATAFRSPTTAVTSRRPPFQGQRFQPATSHPSRPGFRTRSALQLHYRPLDCPGCGRFTVAGPLHFHPSGSACRAHRLHSPPGLLPPSGSKRSTAFAACRSAWRIRPISLRSPQRLPFTSLGYGSPFRFRYVSAGLLFLKPLGTSFTMLPKPASVNTFRWLFHSFSSIIMSFIFRRLWGLVGACNVDKTSASTPVFAIL